MKKPINKLTSVIISALLSFNFCFGLRVYGEDKPQELDKEDVQLAEEEEETQEIKLYGDINDDGIVDVTDLTTFSLYLLGDIEIDDSVYDQMDMNDDELSDIADLAILKQYTMGDEVLFVGSEFLNESNAIDGIDGIDGFDLSNGEIFVGCGINVFSGPSLDLTTNLLEFNDDESISNYIKNTNQTACLSNECVSENLLDVYTSLNTSANVSTGKRVPFFSSGVSVQYDRNTNLKSHAKFYNNIISSQLGNQTLKAGSTAKRLINKKMVSEEFFEDINDPDADPQYIFEEYGTHMITQCGFGGTLNISALYNSVEDQDITNVKSAFDFKSAFVEGNGKVDWSSNQKNIHKDSEIHVTATGGTVSLINVSIDGDVGTAGKSIMEWKKTIKDAPTISQIKKSIPVWEFATDKTRQDELFNAFYAEANKLGISLRDYFKREQVTELEDGGVYVIKSANTGKSIHVEAGSKAPGASLILFDCMEGSYPVQEWKATEINGMPGWFRLINMNSGLLLCATGSSPVMQFDEYGTDSYKFKVEKNDDNTVRIISKNNEENVITLDGIYENNGTKLTVKKIDENNWKQKWIIEKVKK